MRDIKIDRAYVVQGVVEGGRITRHARREDALQALPLLARLKYDGSCYAAARGRDTERTLEHLVFGRDMLTPAQRMLKEEIHRQKSLRLSVASRELANSTDIAERARLRKEIEALEKRLAELAAELGTT